MADSEIKVQAALHGRDLLQATGTKVQDASGEHITWTLAANACGDLMKLLKARQAASRDPNQWVIPEGDGHHEILLRELLLKMRGEWKFPLEEAELCHCRAVSTEAVDQAVVAGAHTIEEVRRCTSANTACGTCKPEVEAVLNFRLNSRACRANQG